MTSPPAARIHLMITFFLVTCGVLGCKLLNATNASCAGVASCSIRAVAPRSASKAA
ncbi:hypothetical protein [Streptomyces sp. NPDC088182]|uniref:hypothetical protein n=1 Tax=Streptomyces sp. NPDC088182 TaxID=3365838 RepID=UPI00381CF11C